MTATFNLKTVTSLREHIKYLGPVRRQLCVYSLVRAVHLHIEINDHINRVAFMILIIYFTKVFEDNQTFFSDAYIVT